MREGARRIGLIAGALITLTVALSSLAGLAVGADVDRAISTGLYLVGCFLVVLGFFAGLRGPLRPRATVDEEHHGGQLFGVGISVKGARLSSREERADARATTWLFVGLGVAMVVAGIAVDGRVGFL